MAISRSRKSYSQTNNVMTPLNWMCGAFEIVLIPTGAAQHDNWYGIVCFSAAAFVLVFYAYMYNHFAKKAPRLLQTESYNLRLEELKLQVAPEKEVIVVPGSHSGTTIPQIVTAVVPQFEKKED